MNIWQALFLALLQGSTELFPVSSLGHAVLVPRLLGWDYNQADPTFLPYLTLLHLGTAGALLLVFRDDWVKIIRGFLRAVYRGRLGTDANERLGILIFIGTIPTGLAGAFFKSDLEKLFASPRAAAIFLIINAGIMGTGEVLRRRDERKRARDAVAGLKPEQREAAYETEADLTLPRAAIVGVSQSLALFPGISRSGSTITAGLLAGLKHESAARFSFLLATPIILAAGVLEVPTLFTAGAPLLTYLAGAVVAAVTAYLSARFLLRYFRFGRLDPFAAYCAVIGIVGLVITR
ncbi:MAG TPA: undecaprenyl-diphosphate phosphatase [Candidatus Dormibacteraeota bacterium]|jgi:undecaprenyl-diphosphatase|nr:undecaprenyl-diphosphate phosphatase [Candidatus Dormibacteraeota bacterium]